MLIYAAILLTVSSTANMLLACTQETPVEFVKVARTTRLFLAALSGTAAIGLWFLV